MSRNPICEFILSGTWMLADASAILLSVKISDN